MLPIRSAVTLTIAAALLFAAPAVTCASEAVTGKRMPRLELGPTTITPAQAPPVQRRPSPGRKLLRNVIIGAAVGATLTGIMAYGVNDCTDCNRISGKAIASGAMYGALIGAAIRVSPSRGPSPRCGAKTAMAPLPVGKAIAVNAVVPF